VTSIDTSEFRTRLEQERERIVETIAHLHEENPRNIEDELGELAGRGVDNHLADMATVTFDRELDEGLEEGAQQTLAQINRALARLDDGSYGSCERCGKPIPEERLRARPWATLCIDDQRRADRG
jgi:RNA polymerase-binding transcription factor